MRHTIAILGLCLITLTGGCVYGDLKQVLRTQIAAETGCDSVQVSERQEYTGASRGEYESKGCGEIRRYTCPTEGGLYDYDAQVCTLDSKRAAGPPGAPPPADDDGMMEEEEADEEFEEEADEAEADDEEMSDDEAEDEDEDEEEEEE